MVLLLNRKTLTALTFILFQIIILFDFFFFFLVLRKAFGAFENEETKTIAVNEIGTILEMLGCPQNQLLLINLCQAFDPCSKLKSFYT